ncbi:hypothetical protein AK830_g10756 [Neonectria ditissima]|uniref:FAD/NAD(P)-binding domain-containing protein n=2 Tax=Eukaryota TaxID=2759 RepID=A0A0P7B5N6_9HYPO|nr:hypothetical protein AK830_g10756 [Neonectria ditissima]
MTAVSSQSVPSHMRSVPGSVNIKKAVFPRPPKATIGDPGAIATQVVENANRALDKQDPKALSALFTEDGFWRDHLALSWTFRTVQGRNGIEEFLQGFASSKSGLQLKSIAIDTSSAFRKPQMSFLDAEKESACLRVCFTLKTAVGTGEGVARLVEVGPDDWKIYTLYTALQELDGHEENIFDRRPRGVEHGGKPGRKNWADRRSSEMECEDGNEPLVLILGAGQAGLTIAARLKALGISSLMIDKNERVGDNWRNRYHQLVLHDPIWYDHLPYIKFPAQWPIFTPKDKLADFFASYATLLELNTWMKSEIIDSKWDAKDRRWSVTVNRQLQNGGDETRTFHPRHIIQATGHSGKMNLPAIKGIDAFKGHLLCHSSEFPGARENQEGKKAVVIGSCNSAHDIAQDYYENGYDVTIVQRSTTCVISSEAITEIGLKGLYSEDGPDVADADLIFHSQPAPVLKTNQIGVTAVQNKHDSEMIKGLTKAGFKLDMGPDEAGFFIKYFQRGGGYYMDVGAADLIAQGKIKIKQGQEVDEVLSHGLRFADGTELEADEIVLATGYQNMRTQTRTIFGDEVADAVGDVWGFNDEGEIRTIWQRTGHPGFWFHGGNLALCRYFSKLLALQIKGLEEGVYQYGDS